MSHSGVTCCSKKKLRALYGKWVDALYSLDASVWDKYQDSVKNRGGGAFPPAAPESSANSDRVRLHGAYGAVHIKSVQRLALAHLHLGVQHQEITTIPNEKRQPFSVLLPSNSQKERNSLQAPPEGFALSWVTSLYFTVTHSCGIGRLLWFRPVAMTRCYGFRTTRTCRAAAPPAISTCRDRRCCGAPSRVQPTPHRCVCVCAYVCVCAFLCVCVFVCANACCEIPRPQTHLLTLQGV